MYKRVVQVWRQVQDYSSFYRALRCCPVVGLWSRTYPPSFWLLAQLHSICYISYCTPAIVSLQTAHKNYSGNRDLQFPPL